MVGCISYTANLRHPGAQKSVGPAQSWQKKNVGKKNDSWKQIAEEKIKDKTSP